MLSRVCLVLPQLVSDAGACDLLRHSVPVLYLPHRVVSAPLVCGRLSGFVASWFSVSDVDLLHGLEIAESPCCQRQDSMHELMILHQDT